MRRGSRNSTKEACEVTLMTKSCTQADFDQRQIAFGQQRLSAFDPKLDEVLMRCRAGGSFELTSKVKTTHTRDLGQFGQFYIAAVVVANEFCNLAQLRRGQAARESYRSRAWNRVVPQQMDREHIPQRLCIKPATQSFGLELTQQRHADTVYDRVAMRVAFRDFETAGELRFRSGFRDERRIEIQREVFRVCFQHRLVIETRGYDADVSFRLRASHADAAAGDQFTSTTVSQRKQDDVFAMAMTRQLARTKLAVFEPDAVPRSFPLAHYRISLIDVIHVKHVPGCSWASSLKATARPRQSRIC